MILDIVFKIVLSIYLAGQRKMGKTEVSFRYLRTRASNNQEADMADKRAIGDIMAERRKALSLTQAGLANLAGISRGTVRNIETGTVEPNDSTWERLEPVLGWATGSIRAFQKGGYPVEVLPREALAFILGVLAEAMENEFGLRDRARELLERFKVIVGRAKSNGSLNDEDRIALTDLVDSLEPFADEDLIESTQREIIEWFKRRPTPLRKSLREVEELTEGDYVVHESFGQGKIIAAIGDGEEKEIKVDFEEGVKTLLARYAPIVLIKKSTVEPEEVPSVASTEDRTDLNIDQLGDDILKLFRDGQVIDYYIAEASGTQNVAMVTLLFRKGPGALTAADRRYISSAMNAPVASDLTLRLSDGQFVKVNNKPKAPGFSGPDFSDEQPF